MTKILKEQFFIDFNEKFKISKDIETISYIIPELKNKIESTILYGLFFNEPIFKNEKSFSFDFSFLNKFNEFSFFNKEITDLIINKKIDVLIDDDFNILINEHNSNLIFDDKEYIVSPTLADSEIIFKELIIGDLYDDANIWLLEYMDMYDNFKYELMKKLYFKTYQIGGHGRWIQSDYNDVYVGQLNLNIGDNGSIYLYIKDSSIKSNLDMY